MRLILSSFAVLVLTLTVGMATAFPTSSAFAQNDEIKRKFQSKEARAYVDKLYIGACAEQYMGQFDTSSLSKEKLDGFRVHADIACGCMLEKAHKVFSTDEIADVAKSCCTTVSDLVTENKGRAYYESLQKRYLTFAYNRARMKSCGFVLDGVDLNMPESPSERHVQ
tara:strand:+ start:249157 stop:249657 length:501 start_codon:yes stop_codon:yes gene_type:complete